MTLGRHRDTSADPFSNLLIKQATRTFILRRQVVGSRVDEWNKRRFFALFHLMPA